MKNFFLIILSLIIVSCVSVTKDGKTTNYNLFPSSSQNKNPLTVPQLENFVETTVLHNDPDLFEDPEPIFFLPDNKLVYITNEKKIKGLWFIKTSNIPHRGNEEHAVLCIALDKLNVNQFRYTNCHRIFNVKPNQYMLSTAKCDLEHDTKVKNIKCNWEDRRISFPSTTLKENYELN